MSIHKKILDINSRLRYNKDVPFKERTVSLVYLYYPPAKVLGDPEADAFGTQLW